MSNNTGSSAKRKVGIMYLRLGVDPTRARALDQVQMSPDETCGDLRSRVAEILGLKLDAFLLWAVSNSPRSKIESSSFSYPAK